MSVIHFGVAALGNVARVIASNASGRDMEREVYRAAERLALISQANSACYAYRYAHHVAVRDEGVTPWTVQEIMRAAFAHTADHAQAQSTVGLLHYNCQEDRDYLAEIEGGLAALIEVLEGVIHAIPRKAA